nr:MAG TPA_asm: hypothetical protein [Caudoviricetes sp.]
MPDRVNASLRFFILKFSFRFLDSCARLCGW